MKDAECCYCCHRIDFGTTGLKCIKFNRHAKRLVWDYLKHYVNRYGEHFVNKEGILISNEPLSPRSK